MCKTLRVKIQTGVWFKIANMTVFETLECVFSKPIRELWIDSVLEDQNLLIKYLETNRTLEILGVRIE